ncbi:MAG: preprotein translocase subunit SecG [Clostridia bacterium]|nr:preprotein translocase subunit SecG [Clostridia bacterium]
MGAFEIVTGIILIVFALAIIAVVLLQEGSQSNVGVVSGAADTFLSKNKARQLDTFLARWTKFIAVGFFVMVIVVNVIMYFTK